MYKVYAEPTPPKEGSTDAAFERETVIGWSDADGAVHISTSQRPIITSLKNNPSATLLGLSGDVHFFELPLGLITIRKGKRAANKVVATKSKGRPANVKLCGEPTKSGAPCKSIAGLKTGKCAKHS